MTDPTSPAAAADGPKLAPGHDLFSDVNGGFWAAMTTLFCLVVAGTAHLVLLAADLGQPSSGPIDWAVVVPLCVLAPSVVVFILGTVLAMALDRSLGSNGSVSVRRGGLAIWRRPAWIGLSAALVVVLGTGFLCLMAWLSSSGREVSWEPIVGSSLAMTSFASFGGYFLAARRARVAIAATFVLTFMLLFTFLLTLQALNTEASGGATDQTVSALKGFISDFRGDVALIVAFYFSTDAAIAGLKIWRSGAGSDPGELGRMDRDLATKADPAPKG